MFGDRRGTPTTREGEVGVEAAAARRRQARRAIEAIDLVLGAVEEHHLAGRPRRVAPLPEWIARLAEGGLPIPASILGLRNTVQLHAALMDWQEVLLDTAVPARTHLTRTDRETDLEQRRLSVWGDPG